eukprot:m.235820 g.235820  ORF g.235820 m.235820 type:complete len:94 (-) comp22485_c0_seq6:28-309(-)
MLGQLCDDECFDKVLEEHFVSVAVVEAGGGGASPEAEGCEAESPESDVSVAEAVARRGSANAAIGCSLLFFFKLLSLFTKKKKILSVVFTGYY